MTWRNLAIGSLVLCAWLGWRDCTRGRPRRAAPTVAACEQVLGDRDLGSWHTTTRSRAAGDGEDDGGDGGDATTAGDAPRGDGGLTFYGFHIPGWALELGPQPGENLLAYRDRMVPIAQAAIAPQRARVGRGRDDFAAVANLDDGQKAELDAAVSEAAATIQDRVLNAALGGELSPSRFKPMTGVQLARDVLDAVDHANQRFLGTLREDQRAKLAEHPFDLADYLVFSTRWEDALGM
jgi:hypothetical protein